MYIVFFEYPRGVTLWVVCIALIILTERGRRASVRCAVSDVGEEHRQRRGRALAQCRGAPQRGLQKILRQLF
jgi:hypothetical protein